MAERIKFLDQLLFDLISGLEHPHFSTVFEGLFDETRNYEERLSALSWLVKMKEWNTLLKKLRTAVSLLPSSFVDRVYDIEQLHAASAAEVTERRMLDPNTLMQRLGQDKLTIKDVRDRRHVCRVLKRFLELAFDSRRCPDDDPDARQAVRLSFRSEFQGQGLALIQGHIVSHNALFENVPTSRIDNELESDRHDKMLTESSAIEAATSSKTRVLRPKLYSKVLPFIQSSGFGKTRICVELSTIAPGLLVCLRNEGPNQSFPPQDDAVYNYFAATNDSIELSKLDKHTLENNKTHLRIICWLAVYCRSLAYLEILKQMSGCFQGSISTGADNHQHLHAGPLCWNVVVYRLAVAIYENSSFLPGFKLKRPRRSCPTSRIRHELHVPGFQYSFNLGSDGLGELLTKTLPPQIGTPSFRQDLLKYISDMAGGWYLDLCKRYDGRLSDTGTVPRLVRELLVPHLTALEETATSPQKAASQFNCRTQSFFFLVLDECGTIASMLPAIRRVWHYAAPKYSWILLVDTNSDLAPLAGSAARQGSRRLREAPFAHRLSEPFSSMPLDVNFAKDHRERLFVSVALCGTTRNSLQDKDGAFKGLLHPGAIFTKLLCPADWKWPSTEPTLGLFEDDNQNLIALASQRFPLELSSSSGLEKWHKFVGAQITQRLRFVGRIYSDTDAIDTSVPSEPPLSAAVAWLFRKGPARRIGPRWGMAVKAIVATRASIGLNFGAEGEEGFMLISAIAADVAAGMRYEKELLQEEDGSDDDREPKSEDVYRAVMGLVTLKEWLDTLVGPDIRDVTRVRRTKSLRRSRAEFEREHAECLNEDSKMAADVAPGPAIDNFKQWSSRRWINFKHVVSLEESIQHKEAIDQSLLLELWLRHAAARGISNQEGWDLLIPTYETDDEVPPDGDICINVDRFSYVAVQVKNRANRPTSNELKARIGPLLPLETFSCLELFVDLRGDSGPHAYSFRQSPRSTRHHLLISGMNDTTFPVISKLGGTASKQVTLLFGSAASLLTLEFDQLLASYVRSLDETSQRAFGEATVRARRRYLRIQRIDPAQAETAGDAVDDARDDAKSEMELE